MAVMGRTLLATVALLALGECVYQLQTLDKGVGLLQHHA